MGKFCECTRSGLYYSRYKIIAHLAAFYLKRDIWQTPYLGNPPLVSQTAYVTTDTVLCSSKDFYSQQNILVMDHRSSIT